MKKQVKKQAAKKAAKKQVKVAKVKPVEAKPVEAKPVEAKPIAEDKRAKRREYARAYYQANREKLAAASAKSHAKRATEAKAVMRDAYDMLSGILSEIGEDALRSYGDPSVIGRLATFVKA